MKNLKYLEHNMSLFILPLEYMLDFSKNKLTLNGGNL